MVSISGSKEGSVDGALGPGPAGSLAQPLTGKAPTLQTPPTHLSCLREQPSMCFQLTAPTPRRTPLPSPEYSTPSVGLNHGETGAHCSLGEQLSPAQRRRSVLHSNLPAPHAEEKHAMWKVRGRVLPLPPTSVRWFPQSRPARHRAEHRRFSRHP